MFKRLIIGVLILAMGVFGFVGCGDENDFDPTTISVVLENSISIELVLQEEEYNIAMFPELQLIAVEHLSTFSEDKVRRQLRGDNVEEPINILEFRVSLKLTLYEPTHARARQYVDILNDRDDVWRASLNSYVYPA